MSDDYEKENCTLCRMSFYRPSDFNLYKRRLEKHDAAIERKARLDEHELFRNEADKVEVATRRRPLLQWSIDRCAELSEYKGEDAGQKADNILTCAACGHPIIEDNGNHAHLSIMPLIGWPRYSILCMVGDCNCDRPVGIRLVKKRGKNGKASFETSWGTVSFKRQKKKKEGE